MKFLFISIFILCAVSGYIVFRLQWQAWQRAFGTKPTGPRLKDINIKAWLKIFILALAIAIILVVIYS